MKRFALCLTLLCCLATFAQNPKLAELENKRKQTALDISNTNELLRNTKQSTEALIVHLNLLSNQIASRQKLVMLIEEEVAEIAKQQTKVEAEIASCEAEIKEQQKKYATAIEGLMRTHQTENRLLYILSGKSLAESYRRLSYLREYSAWRSSLAEGIKKKRDELKESKTTLAHTKAQKKTVLGQKTSEQENLKKEEINYQEKTKEAKSKQSELQKILADKRKQAENLNKQIERLIAEEVARQERENKRRAAEEALAEQQRIAAATKSTSTTAKAKPSKSQPSKASTNNRTEPTTSITATPTMRSEDVKLANNFESNKGRLPFPITGRPRITLRFGKQESSEWKLSISSNGIDIQSQAGAQATAVFDGIVTLITPISGYNNCVIIRHGSYYSFYGNIQSTAVSINDKVKTGQSLGKVYTDPDTGTSSLHFEIWKGLDKQNPEPWLKK